MRVPSGMTAVRTLSRIGRWLTRVVRISTPVVHHVGIVVVSAGLALSLPVALSAAASRLLALWARIEDDKIFLVSVEVAVAVALIVVLHGVARHWRHRRVARLARRAGLVDVVHGRRLAHHRSRALKEAHGRGRDVLIIGSTGARSLAHPDGDLHRVIRQCRRARILLLDPDSEGALARARSLVEMDVTLEAFQEDIRRTIAFLRELRAGQKDIRLRLYRELPLLKLAILGDHAWVRPCHHGVELAASPEYVFVHEPAGGGLYEVFYGYFERRWHDPGVIECDLEAGEALEPRRPGS